MTTDWKAVLWRTGRAILASAIAQAVLIQPDFNRPDVYLKLVLTSLITGVLMGLSRALRDGTTGDEPISKLPV